MRNVELCEQYPDLEMLPILPIAEKCEECEDYYTCPVTRILHEHATCDGIALTYQKVMALLMAAMSRPNTTAAKILDHISKVHNALLDEIHEVQYGKSTNLVLYFHKKWIDLECYIPAMDKYKHIRRIVSRFGMLKDEDAVKSAVFQTYNNASDDDYHRYKLSIPVDNMYCDANEESIEAIMATYEEIIALTKERETYNLEMRDILQLYDILNVVLCDRVIIHGIRERNNVKVLMVAVDHMYTTLLKNFVQTVLQNTHRVLMTSATICSHDYEQYSAGNLQNVSFGAGGDPMRTNSKMLIVADSKRYHATGARSRYCKKEEILDRIINILDAYGDENCMIVTISAREAKDLETDLKKVNRPHPVTYYKAADTIGVSSSARVMIAVGVADKPSNAFDAITKTKEESLVLREEAVHCDTWQAWSRAKDPNGKDPSVVFALGCTADQCENVVTWGYNRTVEITPGDRGQKKEVEVLTDTKSITSPKIIQCKDFEEMLYYTNTHRRFKDAYLKCKNRTSNIAKTAYILLISGFQKNDVLTLQVSKESLISDYLINRWDTFAEQSFKGSGYTRLPFPVNETIIKNHVLGKITMGAYSTSAEGTCKWICFDVDCHPKPDDSVEAVISKEQKAETDLKNLTAFLDGHDMRYLVEASGSPHSYHIWLLIKEVEVEKAYYFANAIAKAAGFDGEVNPKQKTWTNRNQYGNLVKLPFAFHRKHKVYSEIFGWEGDTHEITVYDISKLEVPKVKKQKRATTINVKINGVRPCIEAALEKDLSGEQGNKMRVAIVREYWNFGMHDKDQLARLFENQSDFEFEKSRYYVEKITEQDYRVWPQETLAEKCPKFLHCETCDRCDCKQT
jgi:hypothetical protein